MVTLVSSMTEPGESQCTEWSGIKEHCIHRNERAAISNVMQRCVKECEESELSHQITAHRILSTLTCLWE